MTKAERVWSEIATDRDAIEMRFWAMVDRSGDCWLWTGFVKPNGYGQFRVYGTATTNGTDHVHRIALMLRLNRALNPGEQANHQRDCPNRHCVRHVYSGTQSQNLLDATANGHRMARNTKGEKHPRAKLTEAQVLEIRALWQPRRRGLAKLLAERYGICPGYVGHVARGTTWRNDN